MGRFSIRLLFNSPSRQQQVVASNVACSSSPSMTHECFFILYSGLANASRVYIETLSYAYVLLQKSSIRHISHDKGLPPWADQEFLVSYFCRRVPRESETETKCAREIHFDRLRREKKKKRKTTVATVVFRQKLCLHRIYNIFRSSTRRARRVNRFRAMSLLRLSEFTNQFVPFNQISQVIDDVINITLERCSALPSFILVTCVVVLLFLARIEWANRASWKKRWP